MPFKYHLISALIILGSTALQADNLVIPGHLDTDSKLVMPKRGISMDSVLEQFGEPIKHKDAVGDPPITEWVYSDFVVFFEYQTVLHSLDLTTLVMPN